MAEGPHIGREGAVPGKEVGTAGRRRERIVLSVCRRSTGFRRRAGRR